MGCGKSTVGRNLARKTGKRFVDMDAYIEKKTGKTISEIFTDQGEDGFRDIEHEVCLELADKSNLIIATGGGALTFERNVRVFKGKDISCCSTCRSKGYVTACATTRCGRFCSDPIRTRR